MEPNVVTPPNNNTQPTPVAPTPISPSPSVTPSPVPPAPFTPIPPTPASPTANAAPSEYISNPFLNAIRGLVDILRYNPVSVILASLLAIVGYIAAYILIIAGGVIGSPITVLILMLPILVAALVVYGSFIHIAGKSALGENVSTTQALQKGLQKAIPLLGLTILSSLAIFVGFLLLIIPGIYLLARLSLSAIAMFEEDLGAVASMKRSMELTKGHVNEMLGSFFASSLLGSQGLLIGAISLSPIVGRYHDLKILKSSGAPKPKIHWLNFSYIFVIVPIILVVVLLSVGGLKQNNKNTENTVKQLNNSNSSSTSDYDYDYDSYSR